MANDKLLGIIFPTVSDPAGKFLGMNKVGDTLGQLKSDLKFYLTTKRGSRWMKPDFGTNLDDYLFQQLDDIAINGIKAEITGGLSKYFVGVTIKSIDIKQSDEKYFVGFIINAEYSNGIFKENLNLDVDF